MTTTITTPARRRTHQSTTSTGTSKAIPYQGDDWAQNLARKMALPMLAMGGIGYVLRKFDFDLAPVALGLVLSPMLELSLRQSLAMSAGDYRIFLERPIAATMLGLGVLLLLLSLKPLIFKSKDWRSEVGLDEQG